MSFARTFVFAAGLAFATAAFAEDPSGKIFKENEVTESALIDALAPAREHGSRSRSIKVQTESSAPARPSPVAVLLHC